MGIFDKILDVFKLESTREMELSSGTSDDDIIPDGQTVYFRNGKMYKVHPTDKESWYDARYLVSDGVLYDLENLESIKSIRTPRWEMLDVMQGYGVTGSLDYVLRMKAGNLFNRKEKELCSTCLWKSTELMFSNTLMGWRKDDYTRLVYWHVQLEMYEEVEKAKNYLMQKGIIFTKVELDKMKPKPKKTAEKKTTARRSPEKKKEPKKEKISYAEKELTMVQRVTLDDMKALNMPFVCNAEIKKFIKKGGHPFAYMDIVGENLRIFREEIEKMNKIINQSLKEYTQLPKRLKIDVGKLVYYSERYGYTRILCEPKTYEGNLSEYPVTLSFMTDLSNLDNNTHGELVYGLSGKIEKAKICFWKNRKHAFLTYKTIDGILTLSEIDSNL